MEEKKHTPKYTAEFRERGVRLYREHRSDYTSDNAAYKAIAGKLGCSHDTLRAWCIQAARDAGEREGLTSEQKARLKALEREVKELRTANEILSEEDQELIQWINSPTNGLLRISRWRSSTAFSGTSVHRTDVLIRFSPQMISFIDDHRGEFGVEPICRVLPIAPATYYAHAAVARDPELASDRAKQDTKDFKEIDRVYKQSKGRYGARKVWHQLRREKKGIARCTVERLMREHGLQGVTRGKKRTTIPDPAQACPDDKVNREFTATAPNQLWVSDFTYVSTWMGMVYVAFVIDVFARRIVGWRVSTSMTTSFVLDALNQAICQRCPAEGSGLIHHSDRGTSICLSATLSGLLRQE